MNKGFSVRVIDTRFHFTGTAVAGFWPFADTNGGREMIHTIVFGVLVCNVATRGQHPALGFRCTQLYAFHTLTFI